MTTKINGRTPEEIKKGLECGYCEDCSYREYRGRNCTGMARADVLVLIQQHEEDKKQLQKTICNQRRQLRVLHAMYEWALGRLQKANLNDRAHFQAFLRERGYDLATMALSESKYQQLERERDAAVEDVRLAVCDDLKCSTCMYKGNESHMCDDCDVHTFCNWQWRGVHEVV